MLTCTKVLENGVLKIEIKTEIYNAIGIYNFNLKYKHLDISMSDGDRKREVNYKAFRVVAESENADDTEDIPITSDIAFGFNGLSAYEVWLKDHEGTLDDYFEFIKGDPPILTAEIDSRGHLVVTTNN